MQKFIKIFNWYFSLIKPRIVLLVIFTALCGISLVEEKWQWAQTWIILFSIALGSGGSACINMWYDKDIDKLMSRTKNRPLVKGSIKPYKALLLGICLTFFSIILMYIYANLLASILLIIAIVYYAIIYTMFLKRYSIYSVVYGAVPGAMPPMIGYSALSGYLSIESVILFLIIFVWSPFHSWALTIFKNKDYLKLNIPILFSNKGLKYNIFQIMIYSFLTIICSYLPYIFDFAGITYLILISILNILLICILYNLRSNKKKYIKNARDLFLFSTIYLFLLFFIIFLHNIF